MDYNRIICTEYPHDIDEHCYKYHDPCKCVCYFGHAINIKTGFCLKNHVPSGFKGNDLLKYFIAVIDKKILAHYKIPLDDRYERTVSNFNYHSLNILAYKESVITKLTKSVDYLNGQLEKYEVDYSEDSKKRRIVKSDVHDKHDKCDRCNKLEKYIDDIKIKNDTFKSSVTHENNELKKINIQLQEKITKLEKLCEEFKITFELTDNVGELMISMIKKNTNLQHEYDLLSSKSSSLLLDNEHLTMTTHVLESEIEKLNTKQTNFDKIIASLKEECDKLKLSNTELHEKIKKYKAVFNKFNSDL